MHPRTPLVVRKLSSTVSFSIYGTAAVTRLHDFEQKSQEMVVFFRRLGYPQRIINPANVRVLATPRWALISEPGGTPAEQPIITLVMTYRPTNILVKNIIRKLAPATRYPNTAAIFQLLLILCAYRCDTNLHYSLVGSALDNTTSTYNYRGTFSCGRTRCNTCLHTNASAFIA